MKTITLISILSLIALTIAWAQTPGTVTGTMTVAGKGIKISNARVLETQDWTLGNDRKFVQVPVLKVFISDVSVDDVEDDFDLGVRAKDGSLHGIRIEFGKKGEILSGSIYDKSFEGGTSSMFTSRIKLEPKVNDKTVSGKIRMDPSSDFGDANYSFNLTFSAPIQHEPKPTLEGTAADGAEPAKAVQEFLRALLAKDLAALKRVLRKEFVEMLEQPDGSESLLALLNESYPAGEVKTLTIVRVFDFGNRAWIEGLSKRKSESGGKDTDVTYRIRALRVNNEWKVQPM